VTFSREAILAYETLRAQALAGQGAGGGWLLLVRYGVCQGLSRWERGCAQTGSTALAGNAALGNAATAPSSHLLPPELIHVMATMVVNLIPKESSHAR
jgi:hypothetical protein